MALKTPAHLEALLFVSGGALERKQILKILAISDEELTQALEVLTGALKGHGLVVIETDTELELRTSPEVAPLIGEYRKSELSLDIGKASLETLAIILYKKGATRSEIDYIRGVNSTTALRSLLMRALIEKKEDATDKRKVRYSATGEALAYLGVSKKEDLPHFAEFTEGILEKTSTMETP